jgi:hypothetical protein
MASHRFRQNLKSPRHVPRAFSHLQPSIQALVSTAQSPGLPMLFCGTSVPKV